MSKKTNTEREILQVLDAVAEDFIFPMLDNANSYFGASRLTVFRDSSEWLVVFSVVQFQAQAQIFFTFVSGFGNKLADKQCQKGMEEIIRKSPDSPWYSEDGKFVLDLHKFTLIIRDSKRTFTPSMADYKRAGIPGNAKMAPEAKVLRYLVHKCVNDLHATPAEMLEACGRQDAKLKIFVSTDEYYHPNLADEELPSSTESFSSLAKAVAMNDPALFIPGESNTHWKNWTECEESFL